MQVWKLGVRAKRSAPISVAVASIAFMIQACASDRAATPEPVASVAPAEAAYELVLKPTLNSAGEVDAIEVHSVLTGGLSAAAERFEMMAPVVYVKVEGIADRIRDLSVVDAQGEVSFTIEDGEPVPGGFPYFRTWTATRDVVFPVEISYRSLVQPANTPNGPAFGIRPSEGGVSGSGAGFLLVPTSADSDVSYLSWDLAAFGEGARGVSTFGEGRTTVPGPPAGLKQGWYMAGDLGHYPDDTAEGGFSGFWLGEFPYDVRSEMIFTQHMYRFLSTFFTHLDPAPDYRVFLRQLDAPPYGGATALQNSFMLSRGPASPYEVGKPGPRQTFAHEMIHQWVGGMSASHGESTWFIEGLTTYYEYTLPFRAGEISLDEYVEGLNHLSEIYYTNPGREMSAEAIVQVGFNDENIRHVPYQRGALYFADLDARIRTVSGGTRGLDTLMERVFRLRESGELDLTLANWAAEASRETGEDELGRLMKYHIEGALLQPSIRAFGHCVEGQEADFDAGAFVVHGVSWREVPGALPASCFELK